MLEKDLQKAVMKYLRDKGAFAFHPHGGGIQRKGLPDVIFCYWGRYGGLELKVPGRENTLTRLQAQTLKRIREAGGIGELVTSVSEVRDILRDIEREEQ